jgi:hypothetical protein
MTASHSSEMLFSKERYEARRGEVRLHMSHFFLKYLNDIYQAFEGDLSTAIVLGEISHHNTEKFFSPEAAANETLRAVQDDPSCWIEMQRCNAYSISAATGIPRETVRRKIAELKKRGWVEDVPKQGIRITKACADHFGADFSLRFLNGLLRTSRTIEALLSEEDESGLKEKKRSGASAGRPLPQPKSKPHKKQK